MPPGRCDVCKSPVVSRWELTSIGRGGRTNVDTEPLNHPEVHRGGEPAWLYTTTTRRQRPSAPTRLPPHLQTRSIPTTTTTPSTPNALQCLHPTPPRYGYRRKPSQLPCARNPQPTEPYPPRTNITLSEESPPSPTHEKFLLTREK